MYATCWRNLLKLELTYRQMVTTLESAGSRKWNQLFKRNILKQGPENGGHCLDHSYLNIFYF